MFTGTMVQPKFPSCPILFMVRVRIKFRLGVRVRVRDRVRVRNSGSAKVSLMSNPLHG
jgi:hypothetical protein